MKRIILGLFVLCSLALISEAKVPWVEIAPVKYSTSTVNADIVAEEYRVIRGTSTTQSITYQADIDNTGYVLAGNIKLQPGQAMTLHQYYGDMLFKAESSSQTIRIHRIMRKAWGAKH